MSSIIRLRKGVIGVILLPSHRHMPAPRAYPTRLATEVAITEHEYQLRRSRSVQCTLCRRRHKVHKARNIMERLPKSLHALVRRVLRQAWELDEADKAEKLIRNLAQRLE